MYLIGKVSIRTYITKDAIKIPTSEGQQMDTRCKIGFLGTEIDCDSGTAVFKVGGVLFLFQDANFRVSSFQIHKLTSSSQDFHP